MATTLEFEVVPTLNSEQAEAIYAQGKEAVVFALLQFAKRLAEQQATEAAGSHQTPATPSGMKPPYAKPSASRRGKKKPGRKAGHLGSRRPIPEEIDWLSEHRAECCPDCGGRLNRCAETRTRYTEDIPRTEPEVTEHAIHRDWCPSCKKKVEPPVPCARPGATLGNRVLGLSAWLHYALGNTLSQIIEVFNFHLQLPLTEGGLMQMWYRLQAIIPPRRNAKIKQHGNSSEQPLERDEVVRGIRDVGRKQWKKDVGYHRRSLAETAMYRMKCCFGAILKNREFGNQRAEARLRCKIFNRFTQLGLPQFEWN